MNQQVQTLKGFRDFIGNDVKKRQWLGEKIRAVFERFGFEPLETPALEYESLLLGKYGEEADKLIFGFEDRGGRRIAMPYDLTIPTARVVAQYRNNLTFPYKRYQMQPVWRSEKPQQGRYREFLQCDADIIGTQSPTADAEILALFYSIYKEIGLDTFKIKINDRQTLIDTIRNSGIPDSRIFSVIQTVDKLDKKSRDEVIAELVNKDFDRTTAETVLKNVDNVTQPPQFKNIIDSVLKMGVPEGVIIFSPTLARGLDYYTGLIFEGVISDYSGGSVGGGGRYDNLLESLVGIKTPAVGMSIGFDRTLEVLEQLGKLPEFVPNAKVLVTVFSKEQLPESMDITNRLRKAGINTECYIEENKKLEAQLKYADKKGIPFVIIAGPEESKNGKLKVKNMTEKTQDEIDRKNVVEYFSKTV